ncbi:MAG: hypothetical protein ACR2PJ_02635 [Pseudomonadales bacterium]
MLDMHNEEVTEKEAPKMKPEMNRVLTSTAVTALGIVGWRFILSSLGAPGLSASGISTGLATAGAVVGGGMMGGVAVVGVSVAAFATIGYKLAGKK